MKKIRTYVLFILTIMWMILIFSMSAKPADESTDISIAFGRIYCELFYPGYSEMTEEEQFFTAEDIDHPLRKAAHVTEFAVLGVLVSLSAGELLSDRKKQFSTALVISVLYAATDELHQLFVPGRSAEVRDVLIDGGGVLAGVVITAIAVFLMDKKQKKSAQNS